MANGNRDAGKERLWREVLARFEKSGVTIREFCRREKLTEPSFYAWRREIARRDREGKPANSKPAKRRAKPRKRPHRKQPAAENAPPAFLPVLLSGDSRIESSGIVIELRGGRRVRLPEATEPMRLAELVLAIEAGQQAAESPA